MASRRGRDAALDSAVREFVSAFIGDEDERGRGSDDEDETPSMCMSHLKDQFGTSFPTAKDTFEATQRKLDNVVEKLNADRAVRKAEVVKGTAVSILGTDAHVEKTGARKSWKLVNIILNLAVRPCETISDHGIGEILPTSEYVLEDDYFSDDDGMKSTEKTKGPSRKASSYSFDSTDPFANVRVPMEQLSDWSEEEDGEESSTSPSCNSPLDEDFLVSSSGEHSPEPRIVLAAEREKLRGQAAWTRRENECGKAYQAALVRASKVYSIAERPNDQLPSKNSHFSVITDKTAVRDIIWALRCPDVVKNSWVFAEDVDGYHARTDVTTENVTPETFRAVAETFVPYLPIPHQLHRRAQEMMANKRAGRCVVAFHVTVLSVLREFNSKLERLYGDSDLKLLGLRSNLEPWFNALSFVSKVEKSVVKCVKAHLVVDFVAFWRILAHESVPWRMALLQRLFTVSFEPYVSMLDKWVSRGEFDDFAEEFAVERTSVDVKSYAFWQEGVERRENAFVPNFLNTDELFCAGRSRAFIQALLDVKDSVFIHSHNAFLEKKDGTCVSVDSSYKGVSEEDAKAAKIIFSRNWKRLEDELVVKDDKQGVLPFSTSLEDFNCYATLVEDAITTPLSVVRERLAREVIVRLDVDFNVINILKTLPDVVLFQDGLVNEMLIELFRGCNDRNDFDEVELNRALQTALRASPEHAPVASVFSVRLNVDLATWQKIRRSGDRLAIIDAFRVEVATAWPLTDFINQEDMELYQSFSNRLLRVRYVRERLCRLKPRILSSFGYHGRFKMSMMWKIRMMAMVFVERVEFFAWNAIINTPYKVFRRGLTTDRIRRYEDLAAHHAAFVERIRLLDFWGDSTIGKRFGAELDSLYVKCMRVADAWEDRKSFIEFTIPQLKKTLRSVKNIVVRCLMLVESYPRRYEFDAVTRDYFAASFGDRRDWAVWSA